MTISGTEATNYEEKDYNGSWFEACGVHQGSSGVWDWNPGYSEIWFSPSAAGSRDWMGLDIELVLGLPSATLQSGGTIPLEELYGSAALNPCIDCRQDVAGLTAAEVEVIAGFEGDACDLEDGPELTLSWDLTWGAEGGPHYAFTGRDKILFSTFTTEACGGY